MDPKRRREKGVPCNDDDDDDDDPKNATTPSGGGKTEKTGRAHLIAHDDDVLMWSSSYEGEKVRRNPLQILSFWYIHVQQNIFTTPTYE